MTIIPRNVGVTTHFQVLEQDTGGADTLQAGALDYQPDKIYDDLYYYLMTVQIKYIINNNNHVIQAFRYTYIYSADI